MATSVEDRQRRLRNIVLAAILFLITTWTYKLSHPDFTLLSSYTGRNKTLHSSNLYASSSGEDGGKPRPTSKPKLGSSHEGDYFNGSVFNKVAVIIEDSYRPEVVPLILHFSIVLGSTWPVIVYTSIESVPSFSSSAALSRYLESGLIQVRTLPQSVLFTDLRTRNKFMTDTWIWESLAPAEHILLFHSDSMLCGNAAKSVEDFSKYDLVGLPVQDKGHRGGLSLRKRSSVLRVLENWEFEETKRREDEQISEDHWFHEKLRKLQEDESIEGIDPEDEGAINLPTSEITQTFSVESIDYPHPLGLHRVHKWKEDQRGKLDDWCPEYKLCSVKKTGKSATLGNGKLSW
ncbi:hypothetical protein CJF30_00003418 [Rutstroemia sp. NJR-2017a BBW]|nr:hypothetical protein CJF30_00003418 [Rutstroemia sp. NJR-2017a BBW]